MPHPSPKLVELARRIVEQEAGGSPDPAASAAAVGTACRRLSDHLADLLGSGGVAALLRRGLHLAQREQPLLAGVAIDGDSATCFTGLAESLSASTAEEATAAAATVLTHMFDVLVSLLGEELAMQPIRKNLPQVTHATQNESGEVK
jgi:hypothetical protein